MALKAADVQKKAAEIADKIKGKAFIGGAKPSAEDIKEFEALLGAGNINVYRWVKHMASFTEAERAAWGAPVKQAKRPEGQAAPAALPKAAAPAAAAAAPAPKAAAPAPAKPAKEDEDSDIDLFGEETEEEKAALEAKKKADAEAATKKKKEAPIAKSSILLDIKPWEDTQDLNELAAKIKANERDGLLWGAHKLVPVAFGVKKLQLLLVIEDDKVSSEDLEDIILGMEDEVQSMDVVAWNKI